MVLRKKPNLVKYILITLNVKTNISLQLTIYLYSGDDRERHPVISGAGNIGFAMDSFLTEMFHKTRKYF